MVINDLKPGHSARITGYEQGQDDYKRKLLTMGLTKGTIITLIKIAPLGDPIEINLRGYNLTLRKAEASILKLEAEQ